MADLRGTAVGGTDLAGSSGKRRLKLFARTSQPHEAADDLMAIALKHRGGDGTVDTAGHGEKNLHSRESTRDACPRPRSRASHDQATIKPP